MAPLTYKNREMYLENVAVAKIVQQFDTPCYVYSAATLLRNLTHFQQAFASPALICFAVKANPNLALLQILASEGCGFDIVSEGELLRVLRVGGDPQKIIFSGVGKQAHEIARAIEANIFCFNIESEDELKTIHSIAQYNNKKVQVAVRVNPDVDGLTHPFISTGQKHNKFGVPHSQAFDLFKQAKTLPHINFVGIACHIGSQIMSLEPFEVALLKLLEIIHALQEIGIPLKHIDMGGGLGIPNANKLPPSRALYVKTLEEKLSHTHLKLIIAPGRALIAEAGFFVVKVIRLKKTEEKYFCIVDGAMNDFIRPALYNAHHPVMPAKLQHKPTQLYEIVGPICESSDTFGEHSLPEVQKDDLLILQHCGAYGATMGSNYNSRIRVPEILIQNGAIQCIRKREALEDLFKEELP